MLEEGQVINEQCINKGKKSDGVFKHEGMVIFVPDTNVGRCYDIKITRVGNTVAFGEVVE